MDLEHIVIVGGGQAAGQVAATLRSRGFAGAIHLVTEEPHLPYERPPISKEVLLGKKPVESCLIKKADFYEKKEITLHVGDPVEALELPPRRVRLASGAHLAFDAAFLCTGSEMVRLKAPGHELGGIFYVRGWGDSEALRPELKPGAHLAIVGGGYIGLEVAAAAIQQGATATVFEAEDEILARVAAPEVGALTRAYHEARGVEFRTGARVSGFTGSDRVDGITLEGGEHVAATAAVVGIGVRARDELAEEAGIACQQGILVDTFGRTSHPQIYAAGDVTRQPSPYADGPVRLESWQNAQFQAMAAAKAALGDQKRPHTIVPWFWSDQGELNIQMQGAPSRWDDVVVRRYPKEELSASAFYLRSGRVVAHNALNAHDDVKPAKKLIEQGRSPDRGALENPAVSLKELVG